MGLYIDVDALELCCAFYFINSRLQENKMYFTWKIPACQKCLKLFSDVLIYPVYDMDIIYL